MQQQQRGRRRTGFAYNDSSPRSIDSRVGRDSRRDDKRRSILPSPDPTPYAGTVRGALIAKHGEEGLKALLDGLVTKPARRRRRRRPRKAVTA